MSVCLSVHISACLSVHMSSRVRVICLHVCPHVCLSTGLWVPMPSSLFDCFSVRLSVYMSVSLHACLQVWLSACSLVYNYGLSFCLSLPTSVKYICRSQSARMPPSMKVIELKPFCCCLVSLSDFDYCTYRTLYFPEFCCELILAWVYSSIVKDIWR